MNSIDAATPAPANVTAAEPAAFTSYSLNYEDVILHRLFPQQPRGFYVDVGAGHPRFENDLYALYQRGWDGINVEPNEAFSALHQELRPRDRTLCLVLSDVADGPVTYYEMAGSGLSTCDEAMARAHAEHGHSFQARSVPVSTLAAILEEAGVRHVDILKVDVEGFEERVLSGNDWERFRPSVVLVEATFPESQERRPTNIHGFMEQRGYRHVLFDGLNDFYLETGFAEPAGLALPPNVFDHFVPREIADLRDQVASLRTNFGSAESYVQSLQAELEASAAALAEVRQQHDDATAQARSAAEAALAELQGQHDEAMAAATALAAENRRLGHQQVHLASENRRLRSAAEQMRNEIHTLNRLLEPLHTMAEHMESRRWHHEQELHTMRADYDRRCGETKAELQTELRRREAELHDATMRLHMIYGSRSWRLTRPWRFAGRLVKRLAG